MENPKISYEAPIERQLDSLAVDMRRLERTFLKKKLNVTSTFTRSSSPGDHYLDEVENGTLNVSGINRNGLLSLSRGLNFT